MRYLTHLSVQRYDILTEINVHKSSLFPIMLAPDKVSEHSKSSHGLISGNHMASSIDMHVPEPVIDLGPPMDPIMNSPDLFRSPLPMMNALPIESIDILEDPRIINNNIILSIVNKNFDSSQTLDNIVCITDCDIVSECCVHFVVAGNELHCRSEYGFVVVHEFGEGFVQAVVVTEIEDAYVTEIHLGGCVVVCDEVEVFGRLFVVSLVNVANCVCLEPCANFSEFPGNDSN